MKVVVPIQIAPANYAKAPAAMGYSNTGDYPEWLVGTTYAIGDRVIVDSLQSTFESLTAGNIGNAPTLATSVNWIRVGASNAWKPFDSVVSSPMIGYTAGSQLLDLMQIRLTGVGRFSTVCVLATRAASVQVTFSPDSGATTTYDLTQYSVNTDPIVDFWTYCFANLNSRRNFIFDDIDGYGSSSAAQLTVVVSNNGTGEAVQVGEIITGAAFDIGDCYAGAKLGLTDYSRKEKNEFGDLTLVERAYSYTGTFEIDIPKAFRNSVQSLIEDIRATNCVFFPSADDANDGLVIFGFEKSFEITYETPLIAHAQLEVEGLT